MKKLKKKSKYEVKFSNDFKKVEIEYTKNPDDEKNKNFSRKPKLFVRNQGEFAGKVNQQTFYSIFAYYLEQKI